MRLAVVVGGTLLSIGFSQEACAHQMHFDIPGGRLADVLAAYARVTSIQLIYKADDVDSVRSKGVQGTMSPEKALAIILQGSNLWVRRFGSGTVALVPRTAPIKAAAKPPASRHCASEEAAPQRSDRPCSALPEIIITGEKLETSLQQAPVSLVALGRDELEGYQIQSLLDLGSGIVPALRIEPYLGRSSALTVGMRGLVPNDATQITRDPTVGIYLNGVYLGRVQGLGAYSLDVERVEVLRGPQGTMFGRNSIGGAINIITRKPGSAFSMEGKLAVSSFSGREAALRVDLPVQESIRASVSASLDTNDGWVKNPMPSQANWHRTDRRGFRTSLVWAFSPDFELQYDWDHSIDHSTPGYSTLMSLDAGDAPIAPLFFVEGKRVRQARGGFVMQPSRGSITGHTVRGSYQVSNAMSVNAIASWRSLNQDQWDQSAGIFAPYHPGATGGRLSYANVSQHQFNGELSASGYAGAFRYLFGVFDFVEEGKDRAAVVDTIKFSPDGTSYSQLPGLDLAAIVPGRSNEVRTRSRAVFGKLAWSPSLLDQRLTFEAGIRYTDETKRGRPILREGVSVTSDDKPMPVIFRARRFDPAASIAFDLNGLNRVYVKWSRAFRAGGANTRSPTFRVYGPEQVATWELGYKANLLDRTLDLNVAAYASQLRNPQIDIPNYRNISRSETVNGSLPAEIRGLEVDAKFLVLPGTVMDAAFTYTAIRSHKATISLDGQGNAVPVTIPYTPKYAASLSLAHNFSLGSTLEAQAQLYGRFRGREHVAGIANVNTSPATDVGGRLDIKGIQWRGLKLELGVWVKNAFNERHEIWTYNNLWPEAYDLRIFNDPRSAGLFLGCEM